MRRYAAVMSKVAATQPGGRESMSSAVLSKVPQDVGNLSEFTPVLTDEILGLFLENDTS